VSHPGVTPTATEGDMWSGGAYSANFTLSNSTNSAIFDGTWKHICVVIQSTTSTKLYINGTLQVTFTEGTTASTSVTGIQIGDATTGRADGYFDGVRIYNSALTSTDVTTLYDNSGVVN
jgi:hypothetical protein